jgi:hypothetical protein
VPLLGLNEESISYTKEALPEALVEASAQCRHRISSVTPRATREPTPAMTQKGPRLVRQAVVWSLLRRDMVILEYICDLVICRTPPHRHDGHRKAAGASARTWLLHILTLCGARHNVPLSRFHCWVLVLFTSFRCSNTLTPGPDPIETLVGGPGSRAPNRHGRLVGFRMDDMPLHFSPTGRLQQTAVGVVVLRLGFAVPIGSGQPLPAPRGRSTQEHPPNR